MYINELDQLVADTAPYTAPNGTHYPWDFPKGHIPGLTLYVNTPAEDASALVAAKVARNTLINAWRAAANQTYFVHAGKQIACDALSRSDIDAVAGSVSLNGAFPVGFPGAWKAVDNSYLSLPDVAAFKAMYASMTLQGTINFEHSQTLKAALAAATSLEEITAITW